MIFLIIIVLIDAYSIGPQKLFRFAFIFLPSEEGAQALRDR